MRTRMHADGHVIAVYVKVRMNVAVDGVATIV